MLAIAESVKSHSLVPDQIKFELLIESRQRRLSKQQIA